MLSVHQTKRVAELMDHPMANMIVVLFQMSVPHDYFFFFTFISYLAPML